MIFDAKEWLEMAQNTIDRLNIDEPEKKAMLNSLIDEEYDRNPFTMDDVSERLTKTVEYGEQFEKNDFTTVVNVLEGRRSFGFELSVLHETRAPSEIHTCFGYASVEEARGAGEASRDHWLEEMRQEQQVGPDR